MSVNLLDQSHLDVMQLLGKKKVANEAYRAEINVQKVSTSVDVNLSTGQQPLHLVFKSIMEELNAVIEVDFNKEKGDAVKGDEATKETTKLKTVGLPEEFTPEATADRIVDLATSFFPAYKEQHPDLDEETALDRFLSIIGSGIDKGFDEARKVLDGLAVLNGDIASNIDKTYKLVQDGLESFKLELLKGINGDKEGADE